MTPRRPLKGIVDFTERFSRWPLCFVLGGLVAMAGLVASVWGSVWIGLALILFVLGDGVMLAALPRFARSYGPPQLPLLALTLLRLLLAIGGSTWVARPWASPVLWGSQAVLSLLATYACWIEPARLDVTRVTLYAPRFKSASPLRLLHISDLHVERVTARERRLLHLVEGLAPDIIVLTGDYLNISYTYDATAQLQTRELLGQLRAPGGVYAIKGSPPVDPPQIMAQLLEGLEITWLRDEIVSLEWHGAPLQIAGVECSFDVQADARKLQRLLDGRGGDAWTLLLYHTPDIMPVAAQTGVDLYLAGHTHGGQLRLPFIGALVTASIYWKRYEMGAYRDRDTLLYVSRGVGMEGYGAPRARFLCPPEITLFTICPSPDPCI
jgi:uncharacterized protein